MRVGFTIFGGGLAGPLMAAYLGQAGHRVRLYEMRADPRTGEGGGGRSINLALSERGTHALREVGVLDRVHEITLPMRGRMMHSRSGQLTFQPYGTRKEHVLYSVSRSRLNQTLLEAAEQHPGVEVMFEVKCRDVDLERGEAQIENLRTGETETVEAGIVIGADGAFSRVRGALGRRDRFDYRQDYLEYGYKELTLPPRRGGGFALDPGALHIWPRRTFMLIALPNQDQTFTCTLFWPFEGPVSFASLQTEERVLDFFRSTFPDVIPLIPDLAAEYRSNPVGSLVTVRCRPWHAEGRAVLIGDACHAVVPFYGQGMNAAFEDCTVLAASIQENSPHWEAAFRTYEVLRKDHVDTLADLALANFVEMRDRTGSRTFLFRKKTERALHRLFPRWYVPLYTMVTFTRIPYAEAVRVARRQDRIVTGLGMVILLLLLLFLARLAGLLG